METLRTSKAWQEVVKKHREQLLAYAKEREALIMKWRWVEPVAGLLVEPREKPA